MEIELQPVFVHAVGECDYALDTPPQMRNGLTIGGAPGGNPARLQPVSHRLPRLPRLNEVVGYCFGLGLHNVREPLLERACNSPVEFDSPAP